MEAMCSDSWLVHPREAETERTRRWEIEHDVQLLEVTRQLHRKVEACEVCVQVGTNTTAEASWIGEKNSGLCLPFGYPCEHLHPDFVYQLTNT